MGEDHVLGDTALGNEEAGFGLIDGQVRRGKRECGKARAHFVRRQNFVRYVLLFAVETGVTKYPAARRAIGTYCGPLNRESRNIRDRPCEEPYV